jgi:cytochrome o ubiquinol oxidase subunit 2
MNSFWIPALGGQMYAMTGMETVLHLTSDTEGEFPGRSANYSGVGFAQMKFTARVLSDADYQAWVLKANQSADVLSKESYDALKQPSDAGPVRYYGMVHMTFSNIVDSFMAGPAGPAPSSMPGMTMPIQP